MTNPDRRSIARFVFILTLIALVAAACSDDSAIENAATDGADQSSTEEGGATDSSTDDAEATEATDASGDAEADDVSTDDVSTDDAATGDAETPAEDAAGDAGDDATDDAAADDAEAGAEDAVDPDDDAAQATTTTTVAAAPGSTTTLPADSGLPPVEERGQNDAGVRIDLDETATLACANAEFARDAVRDNLLDDARRYTAAAADRAEPSAVTGLAELATDMRAAQSGDEISEVMTQALDVCVDHGHQL